jgi:hypothetical protein
MDKNYIKYVLKEIDSDKSLLDVQKHMQASKVSFDELLLTSLQTKGLTSPESKVRIEELKESYKEINQNAKKRSSSNLNMIIAFMVISLVLAGIVYGIVLFNHQDATDEKYNPAAEAAGDVTDGVTEAAEPIMYEEAVEDAADAADATYEIEEGTKAAVDAVADAANDATEAAADAVDPALGEPIDPSTSSFYPATAKRKIREFLRAEDSQSLDKIMSFYSGNIYRYWNIEDPNLYKIRNNYLRVWEKIKYPSNGIEDISQVSDQRFKVSGNYSYWSIKDQKTKTRWATTYFTLDDNYRIISTSD